MNSRVNEIEEIYREYFEDVYKYIYRHIPHIQMAEDVTHEVFCVALKKCDEILNHPYPKRWLMRVARYKIREFHRKMKRWTTEPLEEERTEAGAEEPSYEEMEWEMTALKILSEEEWRLIKNYYLIGVPITDLAEAAGITENNMRVRLHRLKKKLRNGMRDI